MDEDVGHVLVPGGVRPAARQPGLVIRPQPQGIYLISSLPLAETARLLRPGTVEPQTSRSLPARESCFNLFDNAWQVRI